MKTFESRFRAEAEHIRVSPSHGTWDRIQAKTDAHRSRRRLHVARLLNIAAGILLIVALGTAIVLWPGVHTPSATYSMSVEELPVVSGQGGGIYDVANVRKSYADLRGTR